MHFSWGAVKTLETRVTAAKSDLINHCLNDVFPLKNNPLQNHSRLKLVWEHFQARFSFQISVFTVTCITPDYCDPLISLYLAVSKGRQVSVALPELLL